LLHVTWNTTETTERPGGPLGAEDLALVCLF